MSIDDPLAGVALPGPELDGAVCATVDPELWFNDEEHRPTVAKALCMTCPVRVPCLEWALANREEFGVWGGTTQRDRRRLIRQARRGAA